VRRARARSLPKKHLRNQKSDKKELLLGLGAAVRLVSRARYEQTFRSWHQPNSTWSNRGRLLSR
jgi:hypothetical protein